MTAVQSRILAVDPRSRTRGALPTCAELGIGFVTFSPLGKGFPPERSPRQRISARATSGRRFRGSPGRTSGRTRRS
ncbi:hypothetical protein [Mycolicibacterium sp. S2-37]|uniref:hypothetical protein n=1 Tax=Mycolicibacterium sp. S2-37 TaxID=2810297 RepID=UPI0035ABB6FD